MKDFCLDKMMAYITKYDDYDEQQLEKLRYGLEGLYLTISKFVIIIFLSFILGVLKETLLVLVFFNILRFTGFGFHAEKSSQCLFLSIILFTGLPYLFSNFTINTYLKYGIVIIGIVSFLLYAPADTVKRPLPNKKKRYIRKCCTLITGIIYSLIIVFFNNQYISNILIIAILIETVMIHPITYKVFRQPYRNYKNYSVV